MDFGLATLLRPGWRSDEGSSHERSDMRDGTGQAFPYVASLIRATALRFRLQLKLVGQLADAVDRNRHRVDLLLHHAGAVDAGLQEILTGKTERWFVRSCHGFAAPLPLAGEVDEPRAMRSIVPSAAGEGSILLGRLALAETPLPNPLPQAGEGAQLFRGWKRDGRVRPLAACR